MWLVILLALLVAFCVWQFIASRNAVATTVVRSTMTSQQARQAIDGAFGGARAMVWTDANGPGLINKRRRGKDRGITMSIDIEPAPGGGSQLSMWASQYTEYLFLFANFAGSVNSRKKAIARLVASG